MPDSSSISPRPIAARDHSPAAQAAMVWLRALARALKTFRLYNADNAIASELRAEIIRGLLDFLEKFGPMELQFTPGEIFLGEQSVIHPSATGSDRVRTAEEKLPFQFYRDGIRHMTILPDTTPQEIGTLLDALRATGGGPDTQDDLVTLLWQANLAGIRIDAVPLEQVIFLSVSGEPGEGGGSGHGQSFGLTPRGSEIRATLGQAAGTQGLQRDTFDDWGLPASGPEVPKAYEELRPAMADARERFLEHWTQENRLDWSAQAPGVMRRLIALDTSEEMRAALTRSAVTWLVAALQRSAWEEGQHALEMLNELDPTRALINEPVSHALDGLDVDEIAAQLDDCGPEGLSRFTALVVAIGRPAIPLICAALAINEHVRARAAASTALCYLCGDDPELLRPHLTDSRWGLVRNLAFVLGQIGGPEVVPLLRLAATHPEVRVRREVVQSLGSVPTEMRVPILIQQLDTRDSRLLAATLSMMTREKGPRVARAILDRISAPDFESRAEDDQRALFAALAEVADDDVVPRLEALLLKGGWFARQTLERIGAARTLRRIGTPLAHALLQEGLRSKSDAVRSACLDAMGSKGHP